MLLRNSDSQVEWLNQRSQVPRHSYSLRLCAKIALHLHRALNESELAQLAPIPLVSESDCADYFGFSYAYGVNGWGDITNALISALELATQMSSFSNMTLFVFQYAISARNLFSEVRRWYPICFFEWQMAVKRSMSHSFGPSKSSRPAPSMKCHSKTYVESVTAKLKPFCAHTVPGRCSKCSAWLGIENQEGRKQIEKADSDQLWCARNVGETLVRCLPLEPREVATRLQNGLTALVNANCNMCTFRQKCGLGPGSFQIFRSLGQSCRSLYRSQSRRS